MKVKKFFLFAAAGIAVGFINGFFGGGGGMLLVPAIYLINKTEQKKAQATAVMCILPLCLVSFFGYLNFVEIEWAKLLYVLFGSVAGGIVGGFLLKKLSNKVLQIIFILVMIASGIKMLF